MLTYKIVQIDVGQLDFNRRETIAVGLSLSKAIEFCKDFRSDKRVREGSYVFYQKEDNVK